MGKQMQFRSDKLPSVGPKAAIIVWYVLCATAATWMSLSAAASPSAGDRGRGALVLACAAVYIGRAAHTLFTFVQRRVPWWEAAWGGSLIGVVLFVYLRDGLRAPQPLTAVDALALALYLAGSYFGTASEWSRHRWKSITENRGHLYTGGLFRHSRHINYFGDLLLFLGFGLLTRELWTVMVPLAMGLNFVLVIIPAHDAYLAERYGDEFAAHARTTRTLIPFVY